MTRKIILFMILLLMTSNYLFCQTDVTGETALYKELEKVDKKLNFTYKKTLKILSAENRKILLNEQRKWIEERDLKCENDKEVGVIGNKLKIDCLIQETSKRTNYLMQWKTKIKAKLTIAYYCT